MSELATPHGSSTRFLPRIESLRGVAALTVVGFHVAGVMSASAPYGRIDAFIYKILSAALNGTGAVVAFFVISGFVLARSLEANPDPVRFVRNRIFRLVPAAAAAVALLTFLHWRFGFFVGYEGDFAPVNVILNMLMIKSDINGPMWSMTVECAATPLILLSVWLFYKRGEGALWAVIGVLFALSFWGAYVHLLGGVTNLAPLYAFAVGCLVHFRGERVASAIGRNWATPIAVLSVIVFAICGSRHQSGIVLMLECIAAAIFVILVVWQPGAALFKLLDARPVRFFGSISYSFYLLHLLGMSVAFWLLSPLELYAAGMAVSAVTILATAASILLTAPVAYLSWRWIEIPASAWGEACIRIGVRHSGRFNRQARAIAPAFADGEADGDTGHQSTGRPNNTVA
jgi:peptidoglycan/LPS O-acetylase OafA/YrhL